MLRALTTSKNSNSAFRSSFLVTPCTPFLWGSGCSEPIPLSQLWNGEGMEMRYRPDFGKFTVAWRKRLRLGACPNNRCSIPSESGSSLGYEQVFSALEYRSDAASAAECAGLRAERPCVAVYR